MPKKHKLPEFTARFDWDPDFSAMEANVRRGLDKLVAEGKASRDGDTYKILATGEQYTFNPLSTRFEAHYMPARPSPYTPPKQTVLLGSLSWEEHYTKASSCTACRLCETRKKVVVAKGTVPCDILFVGEAPGLNEDSIGKPFVGPAGKLLDHFIEEAQYHKDKIRYAMTNLICCLPTHPDSNERGYTEPPAFAVASCASRLADFIQLCKPKIIIAVGQHAMNWLPILLAGSRLEEIVEIKHPAAILRADQTMQGVMGQRVVATLMDTAEDLTTMEVMGRSREEKNEEFASQYGRNPLGELLAENIRVVISKNASYQESTQSDSDLSF